MKITVSEQAAEVCQHILLMARTLMYSYICLALHICTAKQIFFINKLYKHLNVCLKQIYMRLQINTYLLTSTCKCHLDDIWKTEKIYLCFN